MSVRRTNRFWTASLDLNFFFDFWKFFVSMRLAISFTVVQISYFSDLQIKIFGCLKILGEVWAGRACVGANQQELTTYTKLYGQEEGEFFWKKACPVGNCGPQSNRLRASPPPFFVILAFNLLIYYFYYFAL
jgi:hypothetical protein